MYNQRHLHGLCHETHNFLEFWLVETQLKFSLTARTHARNSPLNQWESVRVKGPNAPNYWTDSTPFYERPVPNP